MPVETLNILFLCTGNSCRSQMAEGWTRHLKGQEFEAYSAGVERHGMNPYAVRVMAEAGVDITGQTSKLVDELPQVTFDVVVTVCDNAKENCPYFPGAARRVHKAFGDPPRLAAGLTGEEAILDVYRRVRDEVRDFVRGMPESLHA
ncbi:MAG: arsenate reductase ArsC [Humidesulfovibrio sp.]|nr:arsenate reductase ArsC [Humidesulfovibrio sp.]